MSEGFQIRKIAIRWLFWTATVAVLTVLALSPATLGQTVLSGHIAYNCGGDVCVFTLPNGPDTNVTNGQIAAANPKISPDGTKIAFDAAGVYVMNLDGTNRQLISSLAGGPPAWSPDGMRLAFSVSGKTKANNGIWVVNADGSSPVHLTSFGNWPAWSPDGTQMTFSYNNEIWLMDVANPSDAHQVLPCAASNGGITGGVIDVVWSPGAKILFAGFVNQQSSYELFTCDLTATTNGLTRLTHSAKYDYEPSWSPSASMIAWASGRTPAGIWIMNANGTSPETLPALGGGRQPSWGP